jgi:aspartate dehydrogenase
MMIVGVVGLGVIGRAICRALDDGIDGLSLGGATARDAERGEAFLRTLATKPPYLEIDALIAASDLLVEASTQAHLRQWAPRALAAGKSLMVLSCGALLGHEEWATRARERGARILVPSGAIGGLDAVKGARVGRITSVTMETHKPPAALAGAPYIVDRRIDVDAITEPTLIFDGPATEAVKGFPANVNVVAALSLAGVGPERTAIKLYAVPGLRFNSHRITVEGEHGRVAIEIENVPSENPRTGRLSSMSAIAMLRDLNATLRVGT